MIQIGDYVVSDLDGKKYRVVDFKPVEYFEQELSHIKRPWGTIVLEDQAGAKHWVYDWEVSEID